MLKNWIRWHGFGAFALILGGMAIFWLLIADTLVEYAIEKAGTKAVGARVDLRSADLSLFPLGLTLSGLEVTNPDEPMRNAFEAGELAFLMDSGMLLHGKLIIDEMSARRLRLDTERSSSGAIKKKKEPVQEDPGTGTAEGKATGLKATGFEVPDADEIMKHEELQTLRLADMVSEAIDEKEKHWDSRLKTLPDSGDLKEFERRYTEIEKKFKGSTRDKLEAVSEAKKLQKDIKAAKDTVNRAASDMEADYKKLRTDINSALKAPEKDLRRLKDKYQISAKGAGNLSSLIFGPKVNEYIEKARSIYLLAEPFMKKSAKKPDETPEKPERGKGVDVRFREFKPAPAFWARVIKADLLLAPGPVSGTIRDLSSDQKETGRPSTFDFAAEGMENTRSIKITGEIDHRDPEAPSDVLFLDIKGNTMENLKLSGSSELPVTIKRGLSDTSVKARLSSGGNLRSTATIRVHSAEMDSSPAGGDMARAMGKAISSLEAFSVEINIRGTLSDYKVSVSSDIDKALKAAVGDILKEESRKFEASLKRGIKEKTDTRLAGLKDKLSGIEGRKSMVTASSGSLDSLLKKSSGIKAGNLLKF